MHPLQIALFVFICLLITSFTGMWITSRLNETWLDGISRDHFKSVRNLIGSLVAVGLSFLLITAKNNYDKKTDELRLEASKIILLHRVLDIYGEQAIFVKQKIVAAVEGQINLLKEASEKKINQKDAFKKAKLESFRESVLSLRETNKNEAWVKTTALNLTQEITGLRWKVFTDLNPNIPNELLIFFFAMLIGIFFNLGLVSHFHWLAVLGLITASASVAAAFFLVIEFDAPYQGFLSVPLEPLVNALEVIR